MGIVSRNLPQGNNMKFLLVLALAAHAYALYYPHGDYYGQVGYVPEKLPPQPFRKREASPLLLGPQCRNRYGAPVPCADPEPDPDQHQDQDPDPNPVWVWGVGMLIKELPA